MTRHLKGYDHLRCDSFAPYVEGKGPVFTLNLWDTGRVEQRFFTKCILAYRLDMRAPDGTNTTLFEGEDYHCAPSDPIDSDRAVAGIMGFLTLRPGDTDEEYFENYTEAQRDYCEQYAESLSCEVEAVLGEEARLAAFE